MLRCLILPRANQALRGMPDVAWTTANIEPDVNCGAATNPTRGRLACLHSRLMRCDSTRLAGH